jgi:nucleotide-binding universal stress UspA family protein
MTKVIAALDNSVAAKPVLTSALALGRALGSAVEALHVPVNGDRVARNTAAAEHVVLQTAEGPVIDRLIEVGQRDDVLALVLGARGSRLDPRPLGSTALAVAVSLAKPLLVVPPDARPPGELRRVLVPMESGSAAMHTPRTIIRLAQGTEVDVIVLHVVGEDSLPQFTDQPQHEQPARVHEFLRRYCPWGIGNVRFEVRIGCCDELVPVVADETDADLIALGWAQELEAGRAPVVSSALGHGRVPVLLVPVHVESETPDSVTALPVGRNG